MILPTAAQAAYMLEHVNDTKVPGIITSSAVCSVAACFAVVLRFLSRYLKHAGFNKDDYFMVIGLVLYIAYNVILSVNTSYQLGRHVILVTDPRMLTILLLWCESLYVFSMVFVKYSILLLYHRIFPGKSFRNILVGVAVFIMAWALAAFFAGIFACYPIAANWDATVEGFCIDYGIVTLVIGVANVIVDFTMLSLPLPQLWKLQMSTRRKILLSFAVSAGSIACIISIVRLAYAKSTLSTADSTWDSVTAGILSGLEVFTALVACCVVTWRPIIDRLFGTSIPAFHGQTAETNGSSGRRRGWDKINVQHDILLESAARSTSDGQTHNGSSMFELRDTLPSTHVLGNENQSTSSTWVGAQPQNQKTHVFAQHGWRR